MLVLSRKPGEKLQIGDSIEVTIVRIGPNTVRLGIEAPRDVNIVRSELQASGEDREPGQRKIEIEIEDLELACAG